MASSLNELNLVQVLEQASNPQHIRSDVQKLAEQQLRQWETQAGFHYLLQSIYLNLSNSLQIRWLAVIQFKNGVINTGDPLELTLYLKMKKPR